MEMPPVPSPSPSPTTRTTSTPKSSKVVLQAQEPVFPPVVAEDDISNGNSANSLPLPPTSQPNTKNVFQHFPMFGNTPYTPFISPQTGFLFPPSPTALRSSSNVGLPQMPGSVTLPFPLLLPVPIPVPIPVFIPVPTAAMPAKDNITEPVNQKGMLLKPFFR